MSQKEQHIIEQ